MGTPIGFVLGVFVMGDQPENKPAQPEVVEGTGETKVEATPSAAHTEAYDRSSPTPTTVAKTGELSQEVKQILGRFAIIGDDASQPGTDARSIWNLNLGEQHRGFGAFGSAMHDVTRTGDGKYIGRDGKPLSSGEINVTFRHLVQGALKAGTSLEDTATILNQGLKGSGFEARFDPEKGTISLVDTQGKKADGTPAERELSRYKPNETPKEQTERMADRFSDMPREQQEAFIKRGISTVLKGMQDIPGGQTADQQRQAFIENFNNQLRASGNTDQTLEFDPKNGAVIKSDEPGRAIEGAATAEVPEGLRLQGKQNLESQYRNLSGFIQNAETNGKTVSDIQAELKKVTGASTGDLDNMAAGLTNDVKEQYGPEFGVRRNGNNQLEMTVRVSDKPPVDMAIPNGMNAEQAREWAKTVKSIQTEAAGPGGLRAAMEGDLGKKVHEQLGSLSPETRKAMLDSINSSLPENAQKLALNPTDNQSIDLTTRDGTRVTQFRPPAVEADRAAIADRKPEGVTEPNKEKYVDAVKGLTSTDINVKQEALRTLRETLRGLSPDEQTAFRDGINAELKAANSGFRISNVDGRVEARATIVVNGQDVTVPRHLEGDPAKVDAFKQIAQGILDGKDPTQLTKAITDLSNKVMSAGKGDFFNSLNGLLAQTNPNLRFQENGLQVKGGTDAQGQQVWRTVPEGMSLSDASQLGKTIPAGLDSNATRNFQQLVESLGQNPNEIFNQQKLDQIKSDLSSLNPEQAKIYRDQINAKLGDNFKLNDNGQLVAKTEHGDVPVPNGLTSEQAEKFRGLVDRALTPGSTGASVGTDLLNALKPPMTAEQQRSFLDAFNEQFKKDHGGQYFTQNGSDLNLNQSQFLPSFISSPVLDTFKGDEGKADFDNLLRSANFENPGANPKVEAIRESFTKLKENPGDAQAMKDLLTKLKEANFSPAQIEALQRAFQADKPENPPLKIGKDGVVQVGDTTLIRTSAGNFMSFTGAISPDAAQNLKYAAEQIDPQNPISAFTAKNISEVLKSVTDPTVRNNIVQSFNSFLEGVHSQDRIAQHPNGDGIFVKHTDAGLVETNRWVKGTGVEATPAEVAKNTLDRAIQNPTDAKALVTELERNLEALTSEVEGMLEHGNPPFSQEVQDKIKALYQNGGEATKKLIERSLAVVADFDLASKIGMKDNALKVVEFSRDIKANGLDTVGTKLSEYLSLLTPQARAEVMADLRSSVEASTSLGHTLAFNEQNELVLMKGNEVKDGYPNGRMGEILDKMRAAGIADPYIIKNIAKISDAFTQIKANDTAGLKAFLEQLNVAKLDSATQAKLVAGLNEQFHTNVSMSADGVITDGTNSFRLAEVNGKAMAIPASLSADLVAKLGNKDQLRTELTRLANSGDISQLKLLLQAGNGDFNDVVAQALRSSSRTDTAALASELGLASDVVAAADVRDKQLAYQNEIKALLPEGTSPDVVARIAAQFDKFKAAVAAGNGPAALAEFATAAKGNLSTALIDKLNTQLSGFRLASGPGTLALAKIGTDNTNSYIASVNTADAVENTGGIMAANAAEGMPTPKIFTPGEVARVGQLQSEANPPILEMPKDPALPERVMSQLYGLAIETRLELQVALKGKTDPVERARIVQDILIKKGLDIMHHATTSENGMNLAQRQAFVEAMNRFLLSAAPIDKFSAELKDFRFKLSGDATNATVSLEGDGKSIPLTETEVRNRLFEQRLGSDLGLGVSQHKELRDSVRALREAPTAEARETAYKALLATMTSLNLSAEQMKKMVDTLQDPKFKFMEGTGTLSYDGPPPLNLKHFKAVTGDFYVPGDLTKPQFDTLRGYIAGFADNRNNFVTNVDKFRLFLGQLSPQQRDVVVKATEHSLNFRRWGMQGEVKLSIEGSNLIVDGGLTYKREWAITTDAAAPRRVETDKFEVNGKQYDYPPNLTDAQKEQLKGVITELGKPPAGAITQAVRDQLATLLKDVPIGTARTEMLRTINAASGELQKTAFTLEGNKLAIVTDGKPVTPPIEIPAPTAGPADLATAMKELQSLINCNVNPDTGLMRKAIADVARLFAKEKGSNFSPAELARMLNTAGMENFKFTVDSTTKPGQTEIVVTDKSGKEINRINTRDLLGDATVAASTPEAPVGPKFEPVDLSQIPPEKQPLARAIFEATNIQDMMKAIKAAQAAGLTQFKIGNDVYRIDVKGLNSTTSLVHLTVNGKIAVKAVDRNGTFHPQSDGKFFGSAYTAANPTSPFGERAIKMKLSTPQEVATAIQAGALTPGRTTDGPLSAQQVQDRLKELGVSVPDTTNAQTAFKQIQDLQNAIRSANPADIKKALDVLKGNNDVKPQIDTLLAKINESPANALKIEGDAIKLQIGNQKFDIPPTWDANTIRNLVRLSTTDAKVAANLYRYMNDAQSAVADKGAIMRNLLNSGLDAKQQSSLLMEAFKFEKGRNPDYTIQKFVEDLKVIPNAGKPEEPIFEFKGGAFVVTDKSGAVRASIPETDIKATVAAQQLRNMFDATRPGTDPKQADFNPALLPKAADIANVLRNLTPPERAKAIADLKADLQTRGIRLDITNPASTSPRVEMTYDNPATKQQVRDSAAITDAAVPPVTPEVATAMGDALKGLLSRTTPPPTRADVDALLKSWTDKLNTPGLDRKAFVDLITKQLGSTGKLELQGEGADAKLVFTGKVGDTVLDTTVPLGAPRDVAAVTGPRTDVPKVEDISGVPADKAPLVQAIFAAGDMNAMLKAISDAKKAGVTQFKIGNDVFNLQVIGVGNKTSLIHMTVNGKIAVKAVDRNGVYSPQMDGKFFGSNFKHAGLTDRMTQWKMGTPQEVAATLRAGTVRPGDTTVGATVPLEAPLTPQVIQERLTALGMNIPDAEKAKAAYTQIQDLQNALRSSNPTDVRKALTALKANTDVAPKIADLITKVNDATGSNGALKIDGDTIKMQIGDKRYPIPDNWDSNTVRSLSRLAATDAATAVNVHFYITESQKPGADKVAILKTLLTSATDNNLAAKTLLEVFKRESALNPALTLKQFSENFANARPEGHKLEYVNNALVLKDNKNIARVTIPESGARMAVASQALLNLVDTSAPGLDPKKPNFNSALVPKAEKIAEILKTLTPEERAVAVANLTTALGERNIRLALTGTKESPMVEVSFDTSRGRVMDAKRIGDAAAPANSEQTALNMGTKLKELLADPKTTPELLNNYLKTMAGQLNTPGLDRAAFLRQVQASLDAGTPPKTRLDLTGTGADAQLLLKRDGKPDVAIALRDAPAPTPDKAAASIEDLAKARGIDVSKIPAEGTPQRKLFEAMLRGADGRTLTLLVKELYGKGLRTLDLPDVNGKMRKMNLQVSGHYVHLYAADDSGRMRIAIRGTTDGRPQRGGYFGTRWTESMLGKSIIGTNKDATTPVANPEVANPEVPAVGSTIKPPEYRTNPEAMANLEQLVGNPAETGKPDYEARVSQLFSEAVRHEIATKGKEKGAEIALSLQEKFGKKGLQINFDKAAGVFSVRRDYNWNNLTEVDLANVPDKGQPESVAQRAARYLEPFGAMSREQQKAQLAKIATEISSLGLTQGTQMVEALQTQLRKQASADSRLKGLNLTLRNNNEIVLERSRIQPRVGKVIDYTDTTPVKFSTPVAPGDLNSFSTRMQEITATNDGKTPNAAVEEFTKFVQSLPQNANRARILNEALKQAILTHSMLNPTADATSLQNTFNPILQQANRAFSLQAVGGDLNIKGLTNPAESIKATDLASAAADFRIAQQLRPFGNELAALAASGGRDFSANFALFAKANKDNPALVTAALKMALKQQLRLVPDQDMTKAMELYNSRLKNSGLDYSVVSDGLLGNISLQRKQGDTVQTVGAISPREMLSDTKFNELLDTKPMNFALAISNQNDAKITEVLSTLGAFFNSNKMTGEQINKFLQTLNANQRSVEIKVEGNRLTFRRKAAA